MKATALRPPEESPQSPDTLLFRSPLLLVGRFRAPVAHPRFHVSGPIENHIFVFPRTSVEIRHEAARPFLAEPNVVTFYNRGQLYSRAAVDPAGDRCEWFAFDDAVLVDAVRLFDPSAVERPDRPFPFHFGPSDSESYWRQRRVVETLAAARPGEDLGVEEEMLAVLARLLARAFRKRPPAGGASARRRRRELAEAARGLLAARFREPLTLSGIARALSVSPFHLSRIFREATGSTLHAYRDALRLAAALEAIESGGELTGIALDHGYSSHSHFTAAFRARFGLTPSRARQLLRR